MATFLVSNESDHLESRDDFDLSDTGFDIMSVAILYKLDTLLSR